MSHWHYQLMRHLTSEGETYYAIHEYYPMEGGNAWTETACRVDGESKSDVVWMLEQMLIDIDKHGVKDYDAEP